MTITLAFDSFKGSLRSDEVADAFEDGLRTSMPDCTILKANIADGGEGTMDALTGKLNATTISMATTDPLDRPINAKYSIIDNGNTAIIELAVASGLTLLKNEERNPMLTSTYGTGLLIADALKRGCKKIILGIGGSATNDGGTGILDALGFRFLDTNGNRLRGCGESLAKIHTIDTTQVMPEVKETTFILACDVTNPLCGPNGAAHIFAKQKGGTPDMIQSLDKGLHKFAEIIGYHTNMHIYSIQGSGAAGGVGGGLVGMLNARLERGIEVILDIIGFENMVMKSDYVITGEGKIDHQTLMGKAPSGVLQIATRHGVPTIAIGGDVEWCEELEQRGFHTIVNINTDNIPLKTAMLHDIAIENVRRAGIRIGKLLYICQNKTT